MDDAETRQGPAAFTNPWRYVVAKREPIGNLTAYTNGNQTAIRSSRGNTAGNDTFDINQSYRAVWPAAPGAGGRPAAAPAPLLRRRRGVRSA